MTISGIELSLPDEVQDLKKLKKRDFITWEITRPNSGRGKTTPAVPGQVTPVKRYGKVKSLLYENPKVWC